MDRREWTCGQKTLVGGSVTPSRSCYYSSSQSGKTLQLYKGHQGPVTCLAFHEPNVLLTGSWDTVSRTFFPADHSNDAFSLDNQGMEDVCRCLPWIPVIGF